MNTNKIKISSPPNIDLLVPEGWQDYELLDSGNGRKLERYGPFTCVRPAPQAVWSPALSEKAWGEAQGIFQPTREESGGHWSFQDESQPASWEMRYKNLHFNALVSSSRHMGVFPEQAVHWDWLADLIRASREPVQVINLFGYTGLATLAAAQAGARVTHVDASKKAVQSARENQALSGLENAPIRWIVDDAVKFVRREERRQVKYDGIILDPPKFGRGPKGEVWEFFDWLPRLLLACRAILSPQPLFIVLTAYAIQASATSLYNALDEMMSGFSGKTTCGELALKEKSAGRLMSMAIYARWSAINENT